MDFIIVTEDQFEELRALQIAYKRSIGEDAPGPEELDRLAAALREGSIRFYACREGGRLVGCCSVSTVFSTFDYRLSGVFEDFYILPEHRHRGIAKQLVRFAYEHSGVGSMTVGCADCDVEMYKALGFTVPLGNMLSFEG